MLCLYPIDFPYKELISYQLFQIMFHKVKLSDVTGREHLYARELLYARLVR